MKVTIVVLACMAFAGITATYVPEDMKHVDKPYLEKQAFILNILYRIKDPLMFQEYTKDGFNLVTDKSMYTLYNEYMADFCSQNEMGSILPPGEFFSVVQPFHIKQALGLFNLFYYAKDWDTFVRNAVWARMHVNEGMFIYALELVVIHRPDMKGLTLPPIYEILPQMFLNGKYILKFTEFDEDFFNKYDMLDKELGPVYKHKYASKIFKQRFFLKDWKMWQWWKLMGLDEGFHLEERKAILRNNFELLQNDPKYKALLKDTRVYWMPVDYTRDIGIFNEETKLSYFTEDVGLNAYWYYLNMYFTNFLDTTKLHSNAEKRGDFWFIIRQLLARYYAERLSVGLGYIADFNTCGTFKYGYDPQLIAYNGIGFTYRKNYYEICYYANDKVRNAYTSIERRVYDAIDSGKYVTRDGKTIDLRLPSSIEYISDMLQGNVDFYDKQFFGYWYPIACLYFSGGDFDSKTVLPHDLQNPETNLRDPMFWPIVKKMAGFFEQFMFKIAPYTKEEVVMSSVKVYDAEISKLETFFDLFDIDVSTLLKGKMIFDEGKFVWDKTLLARQLRLNHKPFNFEIKVKSEKAEKVVVRIFLTPVFDEFGQHIDLFTNTQNFMLLDKFVYKLAAGENVIVRNSKDIGYTANDYTTYTELYKYVMLAYGGGQEYPMEVAQRHCRFPQRLILPRGWVKGMPMKVIFFLSPYIGEESDSFTQDYFRCNMDAGDRFIDNLPIGYPFDRRIENIYKFFGPNMLVKDAKIYHTEKYEKYYPNKYENFGTFDYNF